MEKLNKKILVIEDDTDFLFILQKVFTAKGFTVCTAKDGERGIEMAEQEKPDLILSDVLMPKLDGVTMAKKMREKNISAPIILLTNVEKPTTSTDDFEYLIKAKVHIDEIVVKVKNKLGITA